ncbi:ABC transporter ATP-binding protein [Psychromarinibacter halotolerans]|uniref:ABC transporter ATP-binding protein n=1 Tax=Psychromarinibacter halotolerans TaxID=1775175 RepID=A0ABV7GZK0_9RHOB|nr:oligopeptide/dipeptide ABC transporter ATP-binding protein [Psychromarinibacter halotolerans]MDF0598251.1 ATP-binding cassette domain-containing protein [Psychromarinibacter halotolerans]
MTAAPILELDSLIKRFPVKGRLFGPKKTLAAVNGVSLEIRPGETLALVGESGCGKSTVGKTIMKLHDPSEGRILINGRDIAPLSRAGMKPVWRKVQTIFQDPFASLNPRMTAGAIVGEPLTIHGLAKGAEKDRIVAETFRKVGLRPDQMARFAHEFSGGQRQRLSIARALVTEPDLIVADEPVSALDVSIQASVINLLIRLQKEMGLAMLFISHDMSVVEHISHRVAVMYLGRLVESGPRAEIYRNPQHPYTQALLSAVPVADPSLRGRERIVLKGDVPSPIDPPSGCPFRTRCPIAEDVCATAMPKTTTVSEGHGVACHVRARGLAA